MESTIETTIMGYIGHSFIPSQPKARLRVQTRFSRRASCASMFVSGSVLPKVLSLPFDTRLATFM